MITMCHMGHCQARHDARRPSVAGAIIRECERQLIEKVAWSAQCEAPVCLLLPPMLSRAGDGDSTTQRRIDTTRSELLYVHRCV